VASGSYQATTTGSSAVVQFQYVDIGVNLDITPYVLMNREIAMQVGVQIQALAGDRNVGGVTLPVLTNRSVEHEIRLKEGETNILAGLITDTEATSLNGLPGLSKIPVLKYLFSQEQKSRDKTEIIIMLTPHIIRMPNITEADQRHLSIGTEVSKRHHARVSAPQYASELEFENRGALVRALFESAFKAIQLLSESSSCSLRLAGS
jgi:general secretion pathway protein D